ncbi:MAG TPA: DoxX family protein [Leadbetterella sp.]|nr:DoxX family protein [Leadbetterella sp.]
MKKDKIIYWISTGFIFLFEGVMPALTSRTELAKEGIAHLGYQPYFLVMLTVFKVIGALALILPQAPAKVKEWAYAGFGFVFIAAFVGHVSVDGLNGMSFFPLVVFGIMIVSYIYYHKLRNQN